MKSIRAVKNTGKIIIAAIIALLCACVFPLCLIRKNTDIYPTLDIAYESTEFTGKELTQTFVAQTGYLSQIAFDVAFPDENPQAGSLSVRIQEEDETPKVLMEKKLSLQEVNNSSFTTVSVNKWLKRGKLYSYTITTDEETEAVFQAIYTVREEDASAGSRTLYFDGNVIDGQAVTKYVYGVPLNFRNVICLWAFIVMIGLIILNAFSDGQFWDSQKVIRKLDSYLQKYQYPILFLEAAVILLMIVRICRSEAVHWDEAYTWQMVTKNTLPQMFRATAADVHPPLYYMFVMAAMKIFGQKIFVAKMVSAAGAAATMLLGITLVRRNWGVKTAIPFLMTAGLGTQMIYYNVDVRMYSWVMFFVLAAGLSAYEIMLSGRIKWWAAFTAASLGGVYTQYFSVVPLAIIYLFLVVWIIVKDRGQIKKWFLCCAATIAGYLPWLTVVIDTLRRDAADSDAQDKLSGLLEMCRWAFENNIKFSEYMPAILFLTVCFFFILRYKKLPDKERAFRSLIGALLPLSFGVCILLTLVIHHFWDYRYLVDTLMFLWLFIFIFLSRQRFVIWSLGIVWMGIMVLSSYTVMQAREMNTVPWITQAKQLLQQVQGEEKIIYTFPTYDVLYQYYVPGAEFIWYEDADFSDWEDGEMYVISWGANDFPYYLYQEGLLRKEIIGSMRLEEGIWAELWKLTYEE